MLVNYPFKVECYGKYALFTNPYSKTNPRSYPVITPSAARGILDAIYWHPGLRWIPTKIQICGVNSIKEFQDQVQDSLTMVRNEVKTFIEDGDIKRGYLDVTDPSQNKGRVRRRTQYLRNPHYIITAMVDIDDVALNKGYDPDKVFALVQERLHRGGCKHQPYFGRKECTAYFRLCETLPPCPEGLKGIYPLGKIFDDAGQMFYDFDYSKEDRPARWFAPVLKDGVIEIPSPEKVY